MAVKRMRWKMAIECLFYLSVLVFWGSAAEAMSSQDKRETTMHLNAQTTTEQISIPDIDQHAPDVFETASFGLG